MPVRVEEQSRTRRSIDEFGEVLGRSQERTAASLNSVILAWSEIASDLFTGAVQVVADVAEAGADRFDGGTRGSESTGGSGRMSRVLRSQRETLSDVVRIHADAVKQAADIAQNAVNRSTSRATSRSKADAAEVVTP